MLPTDSLVQHISKLENLAMQIKNSGDKLSETAVITKVMSTLPSKYGPRKTSLVMNGRIQANHRVTRT